MKEEIISIEAAKLAKEKGFDTPTPFCFHPNYGLYASGFSYGDEDTHSNYNSKDWAPGYYAAPTQSLLQRWLIENHSLYVRADVMGADDVYPKWVYSIVDLKNSSSNVWNEINNLEESYQDVLKRSHDSMELALEAGLIEALKSIEL